MRALVYGFGVTGKASAVYLTGRGDDVVVIDDVASEQTSAQVAAIGARLASPDDLDRIVSQVDLVVPSPGIAARHPLFGRAEAAGVEVVSEIELGARAWSARLEPRPTLVAVTGTNGKTTVTTLVAHLLESSGRRAVTAGNIGRPLIEAADADVEVIVVEVSSFQLAHTVSLHPKVSCWLNLAADHLDWHPSMQHYAQAKARVWARQGIGDTAVVNADDPVVAGAASTVPPGVALQWFSVRASADFCLSDGWLVGPAGPLVAVRSLPRAFPHDQANALAAAAVALAAGATTDGVATGLASAPQLPHRVSFVARAGGVSWYDDSKATTPASVLAAVTGFGSVVLIAGGRNKGLDLSVLAEAVPPVRAAIAIGEAAPEVQRALQPLVEVRAAKSMAEAVELAEALAAPGDAVVLSPGCASFDWYENYAARGDDFAAVVRRRLEKRSSAC
jgi:UDP-N-acetylmuramoylalanine--D-glutamate ligase